MPFSWTFVGAQRLTGLPLISFVKEEYQQKVDFKEVRDYIVKEKSLRIRMSRTNILACLVLF